MYTPSDFSETNDARIEALINDYGFATLISTHSTGPQVTHAPMQFDSKRRTLIGHIARANPHAKLLADGAHVLVIFHGPHGYVSPTWYVDESANSPNVPTWNYVVVHISGRVSRIDDDTRKWKIVTDLASQYERGSARPWTPGDFAKHAAKLGAIVGFEIAIEKIECKA